jgi:hypothetical protein
MGKASFSELSDYPLKDEDLRVEKANDLPKCAWWGNGADGPTTNTFQHWAFSSLSQSLHTQDESLKYVSIDTKELLFTSLIDPERIGEDQAHGSTQIQSSDCLYYLDAPRQWMDLITNRKGEPKS